MESFSTRVMLKFCLLAVLTIATTIVTGRALAYGKPTESCSLPRPAQSTIRLDGASALVDFSPGGKGEGVIVRAIAAARHTILIQAYSFTDRRIIAALGKARARGVEVRVILDKTDTQPYKGYTPIASIISAEHIPVWIDSSVHIAHNKVMIMDDKDVITGSYNFTYSADYDNAENLLYIHNAPQLAKAYTSNWHWRQSCSQPYNGRPVY